MGAVAGTIPAVVTAIAAFVTYDFLFTEPRLSLAVADPREVLDLVLFLFVALASGRLVATQHARADEAARGAEEANTLFALSRSLATAASTAEAAGGDRGTGAWRGGHASASGSSPGPTSAERLLADTGEGPAPPTPSITSNLVRTPGDEPAHWVRTHTGDRRPGPSAADHPQYRVRIEAERWGSGRSSGRATERTAIRTASRRACSALAADQIAVSLRRDQLRQTAHGARGRPPDRCAQDRT